MKKIVSIAASVFIFISFVFANSAFTQVNEPQTQMEAVLSRKGVLINKNIYAAGEKSVYGVVDKKINITALVISAAGSQDNKKYKGLRVEITEKKGEEEFARPAATFIDMDELDSLSKALVSMMDVTWKWRTEPRGAYKEIFYTTRGGFEIGAYSKGDEMHAYASVPRPEARSKDLPGTLKTTVIFVNVGDLKEIKDIIDRGNALLKEK